MKRRYKGLTKFQRLFTLPEGIKSEEIEAKVHNGILYIRCATF